MVMGSGSGVGGAGIIGSAAGWPGDGVPGDEVVLGAAGEEELLFPPLAPAVLVGDALAGAVAWRLFT